MQHAELEKLRFPIGHYNPGKDINTEKVKQWIDDIKDLPSILKETISGYAPSDLEKKYRPESWTVRQVIHHMADSHINAYGRMKRTLTEDVPDILPYDENKWAQLDDVLSEPIELSIHILEGVHRRLHTAIANLNETQLGRQYKHRDFEVPESMAYLIGMYSWHGRHHIGHLQIALSK